MERHRPGTIGWVDLVTTDLEAASAFYTGMFGWEAEDMPMPDGDGIYRFFRLGGRDAAAAGPMPPELAAQGIPSHWNVWVAGDADQVVGRATAAGGKLLMEPMTLGPAGRLAMVTDPGRRHPDPGAGRVAGGWKLGAGTG